MSMDEYGIFVDHCGEYSILIKQSRSTIGSVELTTCLNGSFRVQDVFVHESLVRAACYNQLLERLVTQHEDLCVVISLLRFNDFNQRFEHETLHRILMQMEFFSSQVMMGTQNVWYSHFEREGQEKTVKNTKLMLVNVETGSWQIEIIPERVVPQSSFEKNSLIATSVDNYSIKTIKYRIK